MKSRNTYNLAGIKSITSVTVSSNLVDKVAVDTKTY